MTVPFHQGSAFTSDPTAADVLSCVCSDACTYENADGFEDWCGEYGYDTDSRKAERIYKTVEHQVERLRSLLGPDYERLVYADEDALVAATA